MWRHCNFTVLLPTPAREIHLSFTQADGADGVLSLCHPTNDTQLSHLIHSATKTSRAPSVDKSSARKSVNLVTLFAVEWQLGVALFDLREFKKVISCPLKKRNRTRNEQCVNAGFEL